MFVLIPVQGRRCQRRRLVYGPFVVFNRCCALPCVPGCHLTILLFPMLGARLRVGSALAALLLQCARLHTMRMAIVFRRGL